jgi:hypothetical protein
MAPLLSRPLVLITLAVVTSGCATARYPLRVNCQSMGMTPVSDPSRRIEFVGSGFSVLPPAGEDWCVQDTSASRVRLGVSRLSGRTLQQQPPRSEVLNSLLVQASAMDLRGERVDSVADVQRRAERLIRETPRHTLSEIRATPDTVLGAECVRIDTVVEERDNPRAPGSVLIIVGRGLTCRHPQSGVWIEVGYSERYVKGLQLLPSLTELRRKELDAFAESLRFMPPR